MPKKVDSYEDKKYRQEEHVNDSLAQSIQDVKHGTVSSAKSWNMALEQLKGVTTKFVGENCLQVTYHRYETATIEDLARDENCEVGKKFIGEFIKEVKKVFKKRTGKELKLKEIKNERGIEKASRLTAETSWMLGYGGKAYGRYLIKNCFLYEFSSNL